MNRRGGEVERKTTETEVKVRIELDGSGYCQSDTGVPFLDHMLNLLARHALLDLTVWARGDLEIDAHHTVEDIGITLGQALQQALGERRGITRFGSCIVPMDEALVMVALDLSGRSYLGYEVTFSTPRVGEFEVELVEEFLRGMVRQSGMTLHLRSLSGRNTHHQVEAVFKGLGLALKQAVQIDPRNQRIPSTKDVLV